jgi:tetratricopeptide (TPR) repeat protein
VIRKNFAKFSEISMIGLAKPCKSQTCYVKFAVVSLAFLAISRKADLPMSLLASLLRELQNPNLSVSDRVERCCEVARRLENRGEYEEARKVLSDYWPRIGEAPKLAGLEETTAGELLLRAGVITGLLGGYRQIPDAQETAKDLITQSHSIFESRQVTGKIAEARTELALCYWRTDQLNEARDCLKEALRLLTIDNELRAKALLRVAVVEHAAARDDKAFRILTKYRPLFLKLNNHTLRGTYHIMLADRLVNLAESRPHSDYIDRALIAYAAASYHFERAEHRPYIANVETNLGYLYFKINRFDEAKEHLDRARRMHVRVNDKRRAAHVDETRARILLALGRISEAERVIHSAVNVQERDGNSFYLTEALITYGRVLARSKSYAASLGTFRRAIELSDDAGLANRAAEAIVAAYRELGDHLVISERGQLLSGRGVGQDKLELEREVIKFALEQTKGKVTPAARLAGMSHQAFTYALRTRHKDLLDKRKPPRRSKQRQ